MSIKDHIKRGILVFFVIVIIIGVYIFIDTAPPNSLPPLPVKVDPVTIDNSAPIDLSQGWEINIRGDRWAIADNLDSKTYDGMTDCDNQIISIRKNQTETGMRSTIMHELLHAGTCGRGKDSDDVDNLYWNSEDPDKHEGIYRLGSYLSNLLSANPDLTLYLAGLKHVKR